MLPIRAFTLLQSLGVKPIEAALFTITGVIGFFLFKKADKKIVQRALDKKANKDEVTNLKEFIDKRLEDIKTLIVVALAKK